MKQFVGVDGCNFGWISIDSRNQEEWKIELFPTIQSLWNEYSNADLILIDIPIGLREEGSTPRLCDIAARKLLTRKRSSSIFPTPCRKALDAPSYYEANQINREMTGKGLSKQTWNISGKIKEVDLLLKNDTKARQVFMESMPELCFFSFAKGTPMKYYKKTKEGIKERLKILKLFCRTIDNILEKGLELYGQAGVSADDILDALVLAISATKGKGNLEIMPTNYEIDSFGLPMRIAFPLINNQS